MTRTKGITFIATSLLLVVGLAGCGDGSDAVDATTSTSRPATSTTQPRVTTTTFQMSAGDRRDIQVLSAVSAMEGSTRTTFISAIEDNRVLERVDVFAVDVANGTATSTGTVTLRVEGSSGFQTEEFQIQQVWELVSTIALFWESPDGVLRNDEGVIKPGLAVVVDGRSYLASYELMVQLAERRISQADWLSATRQ